MAIIKLLQLNYYNCYNLAASAASAFVLVGENHRARSGDLMFKSCIILIIIITFEGHHIQELGISIVLALFVWSYRRNYFKKDSTLHLFF